MGKITSLHLKGVVGSGLNFRLADAFDRLQKTVLFVCEDREKAAYHLNDLEQLLGQESVLFSLQLSKTLSD